MSPRFEFKVVPAPRTGEKMRGVKDAGERFALTLSVLMNQLGRESWEYLRADTLPMEEHSRWGRRVSTSQQTVLVFRRALAAPAAAAVAAPATPALAAAEPMAVPAFLSETPPAARQEPKLARLRALASQLGDRQGASPAPAPVDPPLRRPAAERSPQD